MAGIPHSDPPVGAQEKQSWEPARASRPLSQPPYSTKTSRHYTNPKADTPLLLSPLVFVFSYLLLFSIFLFSQSPQFTLIGCCFSISKSSPSVQVICLHHWVLVALSEISCKCWQLYVSVCPRTITNACRWMKSQIHAEPSQPLFLSGRRKLSHTL